MNRPAKLAAFTFVELLVCISIVAIMAMFAAPGFRFFQEKDNLIAAAELLSADLHWARSEALKRGVDVKVHFSQLNGGIWEYEITTQEAVPETLKTVTSSAFPELADISLSDTFAGDDAIFDYVRGTTEGQAGSVTLTSAQSNYQLKVIVGNLLRIRICSVSSTIKGYDAC